MAASSPMRIVVQGFPNKSGTFQMVLKFDKTIVFIMFKSYTFHEE